MRMEKSTLDTTASPKQDTDTSPERTVDERPNRAWYQSAWHTVQQPGSALQIIIAAVIAIAIGLAVTATVDADDIPEAAPALIELPGTLWLRALRATVLPLIVTAIILAVQNLKAMASGGAKLARWTIFYYVATTIVAILHSIILVDVLWRKLMRVVPEEDLATDTATQETLDENPGDAAHDIVISVFQSFIPNNVVGAIANDELLAVLVTACIVGCMIKGPDSSLLRAVKEVDKIITKVITFLIYLAPIGVFFLILGNLMTLDMASVGVNLGVLIGASIAHMAFHLFVVLPLIFVIIVRKNPYTMWARCAPAWITAWGSASSAATLPVTIRQLRARGVPEVVVKFTAPLGALINMDGTAIYFPIVIVFLATTQGIALNAGDYTLIVLLSVLSSIATTPIPSSSLVLTVIIADSVGIPVLGTYAVVVAIDWFIDRFRTMTNVSGDLYAALVLTKITGITDQDVRSLTEQEALDRAINDQQEDQLVASVEKKVEV